MSEITRKGKHQLFYDILVQNKIMDAKMVDELYAKKKTKMINELNEEAQKLITDYDAYLARLKSVVSPALAKTLMSHYIDPNTRAEFNNYFINPFSFTELMNPNEVSLTELNFKQALSLYEIVDNKSASNVTSAYGRVMEYLEHIEVISLKLNDVKAKEIAKLMFSDQSYTNVIKTNPYRLAKYCSSEDDAKLITKYGEFTFETAAKLFFAFNKTKDDKTMRHFFYYLVNYSVHMVNNDENKANMYYTKNAVFKEARERCFKYAKHDLMPGEFDQAINDLIKRMMVMLNTNNDTLYLYHDYLVEHQAEEKITAMLDAITNCSLDDITYDEKLVKDYGEIGLSEKQMHAVEAIAKQRNGIALLIGSAGTGKTTVAEKLLELERKLNPTLKALFLAPTGRASDILGQSLKTQGRTIHSMLDSEELKNADLIFVDEASMLDIYIFNELINKLSLSTKIVFLGDIKQLESVEKGNVLEDLIASEIVPTHILTEVRRQSKDSGVLCLANEIIDNNIFNGGRYKDVVRCQIASGHEVIDLIHQENYFERINDTQILCPVRKGELGLYNLNSLIQKEHQKVTGNKSVAFHTRDENGFTKTKYFCVGDKVIITKNMKRVVCYDKRTGQELAATGVFNGDSGIIIKMDDKRLGVLLNSKYVILNIAEIANVELGYIITINQSQGGGWEHVYIISDNTYTTKMLLTKKMYYTAVTRSKNKIHLSIPNDVLFNVTKNHDHKSCSSLLVKKEFLEV